MRELCFSRLGGVGDLGPTRSLETACDNLPPIVLSKEFKLQLVRMKTNLHPRQKAMLRCVIYFVGVRNFAGEW